eukprot:TRINITY_DN45719_c0_g1_i2.p1 TRINITY_DN45719_c0_g1~~TRINITY_DN45719_c0_g1_i2.p1  ORF type:complete len:228 (+),score=19.14 TRINITY_DN45719_c0_g1_i2:73-756(+)
MSSQRQTGFLRREKATKLQPGPSYASPLLAVEAGGHDASINATAAEQSSQTIRLREIVLFLLFVASYLLETYTSFGDEWLRPTMSVVDDVGLFMLILFGVLALSIFIRLHTFGEIAWPVTTAVSQFAINLPDEMARSGQYSSWSANYFVSCLFAMVVLFVGTAVGFIADVFILLIPVLLAAMLVGAALGWFALQYIPPETLAIAKPVLGRPGFFGCVAAFLRFVLEP